MRPVILDFLYIHLGKCKGICSYEEVTIDGRYKAPGESLRVISVLEESGEDLVSARCESIRRCVV